jgi:hypothetical protein
MAASKTTERRWVWLFALGLVMLTTIPYLIAAGQSGGVFTGFLYGVEDGNSYIAKMMAGANGDWLFRSPYTAMPQVGLFIYLPYLLLGKVLGPGATHDQLVVLFHLFRVVSLVLLCAATYDFLSLYLKDVNLRRLGLALATLGSGLGWLLIFLGQQTFFGSIPLDFYSPETFGFLANFAIPHLVLARALMLWALVAYLRVTPKTKPAWQTIALWLAMALVHLITAVLALGLVLLHLAYQAARLWLQKKNLQSLRASALHAGVAILATLFVLLPNAWSYLSDGYLKIWMRQNQILSPNPVHYIFAYGWLAPFAYFTIKDWWRKQEPSQSFLLAWLLALLPLLYAPVGLQRRLAEGAWVMLIVLALYAFERGYWAKRRRELWLFALAFPSTLMLIFGALQASGTIVPPVFRPIAEVEAFDQLRASADPGEVVLAAYETGNALPAWLPFSVVVGHGPESPDADKLAAQIRSFFQGRTEDDVRLEFLSRHDVSYVFWGPIEESFGSWDPHDAAYLEQIINVGDYYVFKVDREAID